MAASVVSILLIDVAPSVPSRTFERRKPSTSETVISSRGMAAK